MKRTNTATAAKECDGCGRTEERTAAGWRPVRPVGGLCAACRDARDEANG